MITHVKRNAQNLRGFTKPSHIECAVQFRNQSPFQTQSSNCGSPSKKNSLYYGHRKMQIELREYMRYGGGIYNFRGIF